MVGVGVGANFPESSTVDVGRSNTNQRENATSITMPKTITIGLVLVFLFFGIFGFFF
jgi:hypothetical protein